MAIGPDFYGANQFTAYPFTLKHEPVTRAFIDAQITVDTAYADTSIALTYALISSGSPRKVEIVSGSTVLIEKTSAVFVEVMGAYEVLTVTGDLATATLVIKPDEFDGEYDDVSGLCFVSYVLSSIAADNISAITSQSIEAAGPGQFLSIVTGFHVEAEIEDDKVILHARYRNDGPCTPMIQKQNPGLLRINGDGPDEEGNFQIGGEPDGVFIVDNAPDDNKITVVNTGKPCCDCEEYERFFQYVVKTHERLSSIRLWSLSNQTRYAALLNYIKFLLRAEIVDADPEDEWEAECSP